MDGDGEAGMGSRRTPGDRTRPRALAVTANGELLDELIRIAGRAGVELDVAADTTAARSRFASAPVVLVDAASATRCTRARLPRRPGVVLVAADGGAEPPWDLAHAVGAEHVAVLPTAEAWLVDRLGSVADEPRPARVVAVIGGRGGAGASVFAASLAVTAARGGLQAMLVDADPLGGGADLVLGWETIEGVRWPRAAESGPTGLVDALPGDGALTVLSWGRKGPAGWESGEAAAGLPAEAMAAALDAGRATRELLVVDLPRQLDDAAALSLSTADRTLLVAPAEVRACAAAARVVELIGKHAARLELVVRLPAPGGLKPREISRALGLPLAGVLRPEPHLARALERGEPPAGTGTGPLAALGRRLLTELGLQVNEVPR
jgi:secretion/DNA translocation related CpaE-like protein